MNESAPSFSLQERAQQLADPVERAEAMQAFEEAANVPIDQHLIEQIEALYGGDDGLTDVHTYCVDHMTTHPVHNEFDALMRAAFLIRVRVAFRPVETAGGPMYRRFDPLEEVLTPTEN